MNSQKAVRELWHALFALASPKTEKKLLRVGIKFHQFFCLWQVCGKCWCPCQYVCVKKAYCAYIYIYLCLNVCVSSVGGDRCISASQPGTVSIRRSCNLKQGFQEHVHTSLVLWVTCLDTSLSLLAKGRVTHTRRYERQHTAWFKYRQARTNKAERGEETEVWTEKQREKRGPWRHG